MLQHTFIHLPNIGRVTESELWSSGVHTWADFLDTRDLPSRVRSQADSLRATVAECIDQLQHMNASFFRRIMPNRESWRMYADFRQNAAFLDIETTGLSPDYSIITLVGILDRSGYHSYVYDQNLSDLREALEQYDLIVTYNGASFDLPFIEHHFGSLFQHTAHIDLRFPLRRMGLRGGLKSLERQLDVGRPSDLSALSGYDAVRMWWMWQHGDEGALQTLIRYNAEDVQSLPKLAEIAYNHLSSTIGSPAGPLAPHTYPENDLPYDVDVIARLVAPLSNFP